MEPGFSWTISGATIFAVLGWASSVLAFVWARSGQEASQKGKVQYAYERLDGIDERVESLEKGLETRVATLQAAATLMREQMHEHREQVARTYMPREEAAAMERRQTDAVSRLMDRMDKIEGRLDTMQERILGAIAGLRGQA
ncbi:hypothetical protein [Methylorubrum zatmanii]